MLTDWIADWCGYIVGNGDRTAWRYWVDGVPNWTPHIDEATRFVRRCDAEEVHAEDEDAWCIVKYADVATPSARITGDKDRENPVEGAPYGEGLIGLIDALEAKNELLRRALAYAQDKQISLMLERRDLEAENARLRESEVKAARLLERLRDFDGWTGTYHTGHAFDAKQEAMALLDTRAAQEGLK